MPSRFDKDIKRLKALLSRPPEELAKSWCLETARIDFDEDELPMERDNRLVTECLERVRTDIAKDRSPILERIGALGQVFLLHQDRGRYQHETLVAPYVLMLQDLFFGEAKKDAELILELHSQLLGLWACSPEDFLDVTLDRGFDDLATMKNVANAALKEGRLEVARRMLSWRAVGKSRGEVDWDCALMYLRVLSEAAKLDSVSLSAALEFYEWLLQRCRRARDFERFEEVKRLAKECGAHMLRDADQVLGDASSGRGKQKIKPILDPRAAEWVVVRKDDQYFFVVDGIERTLSNQNSQLLKALWDSPEGASPKKLRSELWGRARKSENALAAAIHSLRGRLVRELVTSRDTVKKLISHADGVYKLDVPDAKRSQRL